ncbi:MAG: purine-nucleoside phosphorylase [Rikenellaceae bacterium]
MLNRIKNITRSVSNIIGEFTPTVGIVIGSGLSSLIDDMHIVHTISYKEIEGFPLSTVEGHAGELLFGTIAGCNVMVQNGRFHHYEGYSTAESTLCIRVMKELGVKVVMLSNAAGAINSSFEIGDIMIIKDHINFIPNPLIGKNHPELGVRFPSMNNAYDKTIREKAWQSGIELKSGVYAAMSGPSYETDAEVRYLRTIGVDSVGMSTAPEVIVARHQDMRVFAASLITNICASETPPTHEEVLEAGQAAAQKMKELFSFIINEIKNIEY